MKKLALLTFLSAASLSAYAGFAPGVVNHRPAGQERTKGNDIHSKAVCEQQHGQWVGQKGYEYCVLPYTDAGKVCKSSKDCTGHCIAPVPNSSLEPTPIHGTCQLNDDPDDCGRPHYENGKVIYFNCD
jgi:hypothetical protein